MEWNREHPAVEAALAVCRRLQESGHEAWWVGGALRDKLLGLEPKDIDIATNAPPGRVQQLFPRHVPIGAAFGVILVTQPPAPVEVATFRGDGPYADARHPDSVHFGDIRQDARRRDFTVNALYYDPFRDHLRDFCGGRADLEARRLRAIGEPRRRFTEDALRLLRAVRFSARYGLVIEPATRAALDELAPAIARVSPERCRDELLRMFTAPGRGQALELLADSGLLAALLPEIEATRGVPQPPEFHPEGDVFEHTRLVLESLPAEPTPSLALAALLHDVGKPPTIEYADRIRFNNHARVGAEIAERVLLRLRCSKALVRRVVELVGDHMRFREVRNMRPATLRRLLGQPGVEEHLELHRADCLASHRDLDHYEFCRAQLDAWAEEGALPRHLLQGRDLLEVGYPPGPALGEMLETLREAQLEGRITTREAALAWLREQHGEPPR